MKTTLLALVATALLVQTSLAQQSASNAMMKSMQSGMNQMMSMKTTGDPDHDFAMMLKMHHQSAVDMSDIEIKQGKNAQVMALAKQIKTANQKEIGELTTFMKSHKPKSTSSKLNQKAMTIMHSGSHSMNGNVDHDFASMMAQHHQQGVDMAKAFLNEAGPPSGKTEKMKTMAQKVVRDQSKEITELKKLETQLASR